MTYALENVVQSNEQVLQLTVALGHEIRKVLSEKSVLYSEEVISQLTDELAYILNWFGLDKRTFSLALHVFPYVLLVDEPDLSVQPDHFLFLLNAAWDNQHEAIVEFILTLPKEDFTYAYVEWLVQAYIHLQEFDKVIQWLDKYRDMERNANWYYWYGLSLAQLGKFQQAKIMLITSVDMDASHFEAWTALERLFLYGLHDLKNANWARQQREQHCQLDEEDSADPYLF